MKRQKTSSDEDGSSVKQRAYSELHSIEDTLVEFEDIDHKLMNLDRECAKEQMKIQRKFDEKKRPILEERKKVIEKIPRFWYDTLCRHPLIAEHIHSEDLDVLKHLKHIELDDNLDDEGSYCISLIFDEGVSDIMEPLVLKKHIIYKDDEEKVQEVTTIKWKSVSPKTLITEKINKMEGDIDKEKFNFSIFDFFDKDFNHNVDIGDIIRRDIFHAPLLYYCDNEQAEEE
ncbi:putative nucleosome assembly protein [Cryptosporidium serpentis]